MDVYLLVEILLSLINLIICFSFENFMDHSKTTLSRIVGEEEGGGVQKQQQQQPQQKQKQKQKDRERGIFKGGDVTTQFYYVLCAYPFVTIACFLI